MGRSSRTIRRSLGKQEDLDTTNHASACKTVEAALPFRLAKDKTIMGVSNAVISTTIVNIQDTFMITDEATNLDPGDTPYTPTVKIPEPTTTPSEYSRLPPAGEPLCELPPMKTTKLAEAHFRQHQTSLRTLLREYKACSKLIWRTNALIKEATNTSSSQTIISRHKTNLHILRSNRKTIHKQIANSKTNWMRRCEQTCDWCMGGDSSAVVYLINKQIETVEKHELYKNKKRYGVYAKGLGYFDTEAQYERFMEELSD